MTHPFQTAKLGTAPFRCIAVFDAPTACQYCGTPIRYRYVCVGSGAEDQSFNVGGDCVCKCGGVSEYAELRRAFLVKRREAERAVKTAERRRLYEERVAAIKAQRAINLKAWIEENAALYAFMQDQRGSFFESLLSNLNYYGTLTENQKAAVTRIMQDSIRRKSRKATSNHVGDLGERLRKQDVVILASKFIRNAEFYPFSPIYLIKMETAVGDQLTWFTGRSYEEGEYTADFTVKDHSVYDGMRQTSITRAKLLKK